MPSKLLPEKFKELEVFADEWALETESERVKKRYSSSMEEIKLFYDAMLPQLETILEYLNLFSLDELPEAEKRLLYLTYSVAEISISVEIFGEPGIPHGYEPARYPSTADGNPSLPYGSTSAHSVTPKN